MKHLTFLLLTTAAFAQQITPDGKYALIPIDKIPIIYQDLKTCDSIIRQDKADIIELTGIVNTLSDNWDIDKERLQTALQEKQNAIEEAWKIESDYKVRLAVTAERNKWYNSRWLWIALGFVGGGYLGSQFVK